MDHQTVSAYNINAQDFCRRYLEQTPKSLHDLVISFFHRGGRTADIGSGSGRDTAWLAANGFVAIGYDASPEMVKLSQRTFPSQSFVLDALPELSSLFTGTFDNVLCSAVLMHLPRGDYIGAVKSFARILKPGGRLILSYREGSSYADRECDGRLYTMIPTGEFTLLLESAGFSVVRSSRQVDCSRADVQWTVILAEKGLLDVARGLDRIQSILVQDAKTATYKFALVRALCRISRTQFPTVSWGAKEVYVPLRPIAKEWLTYYWPLLNAPIFVAQRRGETPASKNPMAIRKPIQNLANTYHKLGLVTALADGDRGVAQVTEVLKKITDTIIKYPAAYTGTLQNKIFSIARALPDHTSGSRISDPFGWIVVPETIWLDVCRFSHWIEDSIVMRWAELTVEMNVGSTVEKWVPYLLSFPDDIRDTSSVRDLLAQQPVKLECVWSGKPLRASDHIDHIIPFSVWNNNDLWNLVPARAAVNSQKRDSLPDIQLIHDRSDCLFRYWRLYQAHFSRQFEVQIDRSLGCNPDASGWETRALSGLTEVVQRLATLRGMRLWSPS